MQCQGNRSGFVRDVGGFGFGLGLGLGLGQRGLGMGDEAVQRRDLGLAQAQVEQLLGALESVLR